MACHVINPQNCIIIKDFNMDGWPSTHASKPVAGGQQNAFGEDTMASLAQCHSGSSACASACPANKQIDGLTTRVDSVRRNGRQDPRGLHWSLVVWQRDALLIVFGNSASTALSARHVKRFENDRLILPCEA
jgi:hypothetical protein